MRFSFLAVLLTSTLSLAHPFHAEQSENKNSLAAPDVERRWENKGHCVAKLRLPHPKNCGVAGNYNHRYKTLSINYGWTLDHCQNDCVCKGETCHSFSWRAGPISPEKGVCIQHEQHLYEMQFSQANANKNSRAYYDRTCFHRAAPSNTAIMTQAATKPTPVPRAVAAAPPVRRDVDLDTALVLALAGN